MAKMATEGQTMTSIPASLTVCQAVVTPMYRITKQMLRLMMFSGMPEMELGGAKILRRPLLLPQGEISSGATFTCSSCKPCQQSCGDICVFHNARHDWILCEVQQYWVQEAARKAVAWYKYRGNVGNNRCNYFHRNNEGVQCRLSLSVEWLI